MKQDNEKLIPENPCPICHRVLGTVNVDRHHLIPKSRKGVEQFWVHRICHRKLHATFTEKELESDLSTWEEIAANEEMEKFVRWVARKESGFYDCTIRAKDKGKRK